MLVTHPESRSSAPSDYRRKLLPLEELVRKLGDARQRGSSVVQCHGCFDIVHPGHVRYLQFARRQGDILVVSITGDADIDKGELRPYIPQELRAENLAALEFVDFVVIDSNPSACKLLAAIRPDIYVKGQEYAASSHAGFLAERAAVEAYGGRVLFSSGDVVFSSSRLVESLRGDQALDRQRLHSVCRRHRITTGEVGSILNAAASQRVLVVGDLRVDRYAVCDADGLAAEAPVVSLRQVGQTDYIGGAGAVAIQAARLGASVLLVTSVGRDDASCAVLEALAGTGVDTAPLYLRRGIAQRTRFVAEDQKLFTVDQIECTPLDSQGERQAAELVLDRARACDVVILADSGYGLLTTGLFQQLGAAFHQRCPLQVGGACDAAADLSLLRHLALCVCSERRLRASMQHAGAGLSTLAYRHLAGSQSRQLLITLAKRGLVAFDRPSHDPAAAEWNGRLRSEYLPALARTVRDRLGAGETILATAAVGLAAGASLMQLAYLASAAAALQVEAAGRDEPSAQTLREWCRGRVELAVEADDEMAADPAEGVALARERGN